MYSLLEYLKSRRTISAVNLCEPGPSAGEIKEILTIACRVPDHGKLAPWRFIHYGPDAGEAIGNALLKRALELNETLDTAQQAQEKERFCRSPLVIGVVSTATDHPKIPIWEQRLAAGAVCLNLIHGARALGFSGQWLTEWYCYDEEASAMLGAKPDEQFAGFIHIGTPSTDPVERARPNVDDMMSTWEPA